MYKSVIIGLGDIAWKYDKKLTLSNNDLILTHASAYQRHKDTILVGGCSPSKHDCAYFEQQYDVPAYNNIDELFRLDPDIVSICSPPNFHFDHAMKCIKAGIPMIWLEKPPASSVEEIDQLLEEINASGSNNKVLVNYQRRYTGCYNDFKKIYKNNYLGTCRSIHITYSKGLELNGIHVLDILFYILQDMEYFLEWVSDPYSKNPSFVITFENALKAYVEGIDLTYHCIDIALTFDSGRASILHGGMTPVLEKKVENECYPGFYRLEISSDNYLGNGGPGSCMQEALNDLIISYDQNKEPISNLLSARKSQVLINQVRQGKRV